MSKERLTTTEAAALLSYWFCHGDAISTRDAARLTGYSQAGIYMLLCKMSRVIPLTCEWRKVSDSRRVYTWFLADLNEPKVR